MEESTKQQFKDTMIQRIVASHNAYYFYFKTFK